MKTSKITLLLFSIFIAISSCSLTKNQRTITKAKAKMLEEAIKLEDNQNKNEATKVKNDLQSVKQIRKKAKKGKASDEEIKEALALVKANQIEEQPSKEPNENDPEPKDENEKQEVKLNLDSLTAKELLAVIDTISGKAKPDKFSLDPDTVFYGFSTGTNFRFVDGVDDASLFLDINANVGQLFHKRITAEFGVISGRFSPIFSNTINEFASGSVEVLSDTTFQRTTYNGTFQQKVEFERKFTRAFGRFNYKFLESPKTKLFVTLEFSYNRIEFNSTINSDTIDVVPNIRPVENGNRTAVPPSFPTDSLTGNLIQDRGSNLLGLKLFKESENFQFTVSAMVGITIINTVDFNTNDNRPPEKSSIFSRVGFDNDFTYVFQGALLEKKVVGAKLGFEIRDLPFDRESPSYYFYISKQFSMLEFFKIFSPSSN